MVAKVKTRTWVAGSKGFTLLELTIVLLLAGIMMAVAIPNFYNALPGVELRTFSNDLAALMRYSRSQAIIRRETVELNFQPANQSISLIPGEQTLYWPDSVSVRWPQSSRFTPQQLPTPIHFYPDGSTDDAQIRVSNDNHHYLITVDWITGQIAIRSHEDEN